MREKGEGERERAGGEERVRRKSIGGRREKRVKGRNFRRRRRRRREREIE